MLNIEKLLEKLNIQNEELDLKIKNLDFRSAHKYQKIIYKNQSIIEQIQNIKELEKKERELEDLLKDPDLVEMVIDELKEIKEEIEKNKLELENLLIQDKDESLKSIIMEIRAGAGGNESSIFANELLKVYEKYAEQKKWKFEIISTSENELGGIKSCAVRITGDQAYKRMQFESGVHRVQRIPITESSDRLHTSTITIVVLPEPEEVDVNIDEKNMRIDTFRASGAGGQHVNTTDSAIRIVYKHKTKDQEHEIEVQCQDERSQHENKRRAIQMLRAKLYDLEKNLAQNELDSLRRDSIGTADRSEKAKTYNFPQNRITDHRFNITLYKLDNIFLGNLDELIDKTIEADRLNRIENLYKN